MEDLKSNKISFKLKYSKGEYIKSIFYISYSSSAIRYVTALGIIFIIVLLSLNKEDRYSSSLTIPYFLILLAIIFPVIIYNSAKKAFNSRLVQEEKLYTIDKESVAIQAESSFVELKWNEFKKLKQTKNTLYLHIAKNQAFIIPKRCLTEFEYKEIINMAGANIKTSRSNTYIVIGLVIVAFCILLGIIKFISNNNIPQ